MKIILISITAIMAIMVICGFIYWHTGIFKWFYHDILEWHYPSDDEYFDGCSCHSICKYCGKEILQDGQGNWF